MQISDKAARVPMEETKRRQQGRGNKKQRCQSKTQAQAQAGPQAEAQT